MSDQIPVYLPTPIRAAKENADRIVAAVACTLLDRAYAILIRQQTLIDTDRAVFGQAAGLVTRATGLLRTTELVRLGECSESLPVPAEPASAEPAAAEPQTQP